MSKNNLELKVEKLEKDVEFLLEFAKTIINYNTQVQPRYLFQNLKKIGDDYFSEKTAYNKAVDENLQKIKDFRNELDPKKHKYESTLLNMIEVIIKSYKK